MRTNTDAVDLLVFREQRFCDRILHDHFLQRIYATLASNQQLFDRADVFVYHVFRLASQIRKRVYGCAHDATQGSQIGEHQKCLREFCVNELCTVMHCSAI